MGSKQAPSAYDCYANAKPDEPMFVLLARDPMSPEIVRAWAAARRNLIAQGKKPASDEVMIAEALVCAEDMERWRAKNWPPQSS